MLHIFQLRLKYSVVDYNDTRTYMFLNRPEANSYKFVLKPNFKV